MGSGTDYIIKGLRYRFRQLFDIFFLPIHNKFVIKRQIKNIRKKNLIKVAFVCSDLSTWRTEYLFKTMMLHPRFLPMVLIIDASEKTAYTKQALAEYMQGKNYPYRVLDSNETIRNTFHPDIIFYQKPYDFSVPDKYNFRCNFYALTCFATYGFHSLRERWSFNTPLRKYSWMVFYENENSLQTAYELVGKYASNGIVTGVPIIDEFLSPEAKEHDPWKKCGENMKRIIWAPHHTISDENSGGINYSTFLNVADGMLELANKYKDKVQWAFKPHPLLRHHLNEKWGKEKTDAYYEKWESMPNTQLEDGRYIELFMHSDAMIHDCGSFTIEYHYTNNPVLYLVKTEKHADNMIEYARKAFDLHYKGGNIKDVEDFIINVINGNDPMKQERKTFLETNLLPPNGDTACNNIMNAILGK